MPKAAPSAINIAEHGQLVHGLTFGVDRLASAFRVLAPVGNEDDPISGDRATSGQSVIAPDHQLFLALRAVPTRRTVVHAAVAHLHAFNFSS
jgi:hypothetical protein